MKFLRIAVVAAFALVSGRAFAFHAGGVAKCEGCHTMHNSATAANGTVSTVMNRVAGQGTGTLGQASAYLLQGKDPSSTCLMCHGPTDVGGYHIYNPNLASTTTANYTVALSNFTPGGDFSWTNNKNIPSSGYNRLGHSLVAADYGMTGDSRKVAPYGNGAQAYDGVGFSCVACHDPHGKNRQTTTGFATTSLGNAVDPIGQSGSYGDAPVAGEAVGAYRLLAGVGYKAKSVPSMPTFAVNPPVAVAPKTYNVSESTFTGAGGAGQTVVAYGSGMSEWCATCHPGMHNDTQLTSGSIFKHPAGNGAKMTNVATTYNDYLKSGDLSGTNAYDAIVPFEQGSGATLTAYDTTAAPAIVASGNSNVMCLSCHRAHASPFDYALRWFDSEFIIEDGAYYGVVEGNRDAAKWRSAAIVQAGMQNRPATAYATFQKSLCNKCHAKD